MRHLAVILVIVALNLSIWGGLIYLGVKIAKLAWGG